MKRKQLDQNEPNKQGLPNIGNSCFLNAALQGLYSVNSFRMKVLTENVKKRENSMILNLKQVFSALSNGQNSQEKFRALNNLQKLLIQQISDYSGHSQEDSSMFLLHMLNRLVEQNNQFNDFFHQNIIIRCHQCFNADVQIQNQVFFSTTKLICSNSSPLASHAAEINFTKVPNGIIFLTQPEIKQQIQINVISSVEKISQNLVKNIKEQTKNLQLKAVIFYSGNQVKGHYVCLRKSQSHISKYILINDLNVSKPKKLQEFNLSKYRGLLYFYQQKKSYPFNSPIQSQSQTYDAEKPSSLKNLLPITNLYPEIVEELYLKGKSQQFMSIASQSSIMNKKQENNSIQTKPGQQKPVNSKQEKSFFRIIFSNLCRYISNICS